MKQINSQQVGFCQELRFFFEWIHLHRAVLTWPSIWHQQSSFKPNPRVSPNPWVSSSKCRALRPHGWPAHPQLFLVKDLISNCQGWVQPFSPSFLYVTCPSPEFCWGQHWWEGSSAPWALTTGLPVLKKVKPSPRSSSANAFFQIFSFCQHCEEVRCCFTLSVCSCTKQQGAGRAALPNWKFGREALCSALGGG